MMLTNSTSVLLALTRLSTEKTILKLMLVISGLLVEGIRQFDKINVNDISMMDALAAYAS